MLWVVGLYPGMYPIWATTAGFRTRELPWAAFGSPYRAVVETFVDGRCLDGGITMSTVRGTLPRGLELRGETISGTPEEFGAFPFRLRTSTNCGADERDFVMLVTGRPILRVAPEEIVLEYRQGGPPPEAQSLLVSATWPNLPYSLTKVGEPWLRVRQQAGATPSPGSPFAGDTVQLQIVTENLAPGFYESVLLFSAPHGAAALSVPVRLRVVAAPTAPVSGTEGGRN
ncbi:MAG: hypothetical protein LAQ69_35995 [Acidobacteriia bacterium]|nr:hypothetical protein [Terriglobia bacterium]